MIGSPARFAVEYELEPIHHGGVWMWGHLRYWCGDSEVGNFGATISLREALFNLEGMRRDIGKRQSKRFQNMAPLEMVRLLDAGLFGWRDLAPSTLPEDEEWARHNIRPGTEAFSGWSVFIVESDRVGRIAYGRRPFMQVSSVEVNTGEVDEVLEQTRRSLDAVYERERKLAGETSERTS